MHAQIRFSNRKLLLHLRLPARDDLQVRQVGQALQVIDTRRRLPHASTTPPNPAHSVPSVDTDDDCSGPSPSEAPAYVQMNEHSVSIRTKDGTWRLELPRIGHVPIAADLPDKMRNQKWPTPEQNEELHAATKGSKELPPPTEDAVTYLP
jgi:hypothetical protein